jgi:hypothetical protein
MPIDNQKEMIEFHCICKESCYKFRPLQNNSMLGGG